MGRALEPETADSNDRTDLFSAELMAHEHLKRLQSFHIYLSEVHDIHLPFGDQEVLWEASKDRLHLLSKQSQSFQLWFEVLQSADRETTGPCSSRIFLWRWLSKCALTVPSDLIGNLNDEDLIEVYDQNLNQVFRNLRFFSVSSYSLIDLLHKPLPELFERHDPHAQTTLMNEIDRRCPHWSGQWNCSFECRPQQGVRVQKWTAAFR